MARERQPTEETPEAEGPRSFTVFLGHIADGEAERELSRHLHQLGQSIMEEVRVRGDKVSGSLTLRVKLLTDTAMHTTVTYAVTTAKPTRKTSGAHFWMTRGGNLSVSDPRQPKLPGLREVPAPGPARDITEPKNAQQGED